MFFSFSCAILSNRRHRYVEIETDMNSTVKNTNNIIEGSIWKPLLAFFFPVLLGTLFQQLYNTVDAVIVGRFVGKEALAAVGGSSAQILNLLIGFFTGVSSGATVIISQYIGAGDDEDVSRAVHTALVVAVAGGALMTALGIAMAPGMLRLMGTPEDTVAGSVSYLRLVFISMIPGMVYNMGSAILRAAGDSRHPLYFLILCCLVNVALDLLFVWGFHMGVAGVAIATSIAQLVSAVMVCGFLYKSSESYRLVPGQLRADKKLVRRTIRIGLPTGIQAVLYSVSNIIITASINSFGTDTVAAWVAVGKLDALNWLIMNAFGISMMTFVGQNFGARRYDRVKSSIRLCLAMAVGTAILLGLLFSFGGRYGLLLFTDDASVLDIAMVILLWLAPWYWLYVPIEVISGGMRGMGSTLVPTLITAAGICLLRVVWIFIVVPFRHEVSAVTVSYPITWFLTALAFIFYYLHFKKTHLAEA